MFAGLVSTVHLIGTPAADTDKDTAIGPPGDHVPTYEIAAHLAFVSNGVCLVVRLCLPLAAGQVFDVFQDVRMERFIVRHQARYFCQLEEVPGAA